MMEFNGVDSSETSAILNINFDSSREAEIARNTLRVDAEPKRSNTRKVFSVSGNTLKVEVFCPDVRELRISLNSLLDHLHLVNQTINKFGPTHPPTKKTCYEKNKQNL